MNFNTCNNMSQLQCTQLQKNGLYDGKNGPHYYAFTLKNPSPKNVTKFFQLLISEYLVHNFSID
jgi:hypothetical protein